MSLMQDDELALLWRQGTSAAPNAEEIARLAGRASVARFDRAIFWRNFREYAAGSMMLIVFGWAIVSGLARKLGLLVYAYGGLLGVGFVCAYMWWQHRGLTPLDPAADARAYQAAMLARIDKQIRLLRSIRYWYLLPLYVPGLWVVKQTWTKSPASAVIVLAILTGAFVFVGWLNEVAAVGKLRVQRSTIAELYADR